MAFAAAESDIRSDDSGRIGDVRGLYAITVRFASRKCIYMAVSGQKNIPNNVISVRKAFTVCEFVGKKMLSKIWKTNMLLTLST